MPRVDAPRVTVICPTYNRSNVLPYAIGSVIEQSYSDWELLVVGDNCTDDSQAVVARVVREHNSQERVRWINLVPSTGNQYGPNNEGIRQARGELIAYIGHDDLWLPHHLQGLVTAIDAGADVANSVTFWALENNRGVTLWASDACDTPGAVLHRRALVDQFGGWRDYREIVATPQAEIWGRFRAQGARFALVPRLSLIKIAAGRREKVYQTQPCHEQQYWQKRIHEEPDLEQQLLVSLLQDTYAAYRAVNGTFVNRMSQHLKQLSRGKLPQFNSYTRRKPGDYLRQLNRQRGVHQD